MGGIQVISYGEDCAKIKQTAGNSLWTIGPPVWLKPAPLHLLSSESDGHLKEIIFGWPKHIDINYFYLTNQMITSLS